MKKLLTLLACFVMCGAAFAAPSTFVELALIDGGENGRNGEGDQFGYEVTGDFAISKSWYAGGVLGRFDRDSSTENIENTYLNVHGGYLFDVAERTGVVAEVGLWFGEEETDSVTTDPTALELKVGVNQSLTAAAGERRAGLLRHGGHQR